MPETAEAMKPWQKGYPLDELKRTAAIFKSHDEGLILGAFSSYKENSVAEARAAGRLWEEPGCAFDVEYLEGKRSVKDFTGTARAWLEPGDLFVKRFAFAPGHEKQAAGALEQMASACQRCWVLAWIEHPGDRELLESLGFRLALTKIKASSELTGLFVREAEQNHAAVEPLPPQDEVALARLARNLPAEQLLAEVEGLGLEFADHYSGYNLKHSWSALALRGYGGGPDFIIKPSEMSKKWKRENAEALDWQLEDTPLRAKLPAAEPLISALPGEPHRIRLMRLAPGGGELARHADITDPDAGTEPGQLLRLHFPLLSNRECVFESWMTDGTKLDASMKPGECWYLDTRKPHTAVNGGKTERLHLVVDMAADEALREQLLAVA